jgi:two-component system sensor histidine kinase KdpD
VAALALLLATVLLVQVRTTVGESTSLAVYLLVVVAVSAIGGLAPGLSAAVMAPLLANWFLIPPYHTFRIADRGHVVELLVFVAVAVAVSSFVSISARRAREAERARREATILAELAGPVGSDPLDRIVDHLRTSFSLDGVALLRRNSATADWVCLAAAGTHPPAHPDSAEVAEPVDDDVLLVATGGVLTADDHRVLGSFVQQLRLAIEQQRLSETAARAEVLDRADELRTAMLRAVSHDLRTPLAGIKASVSSLRQHDVEWPPDVRDEFLEAIEDDTDRLTAIVTNLLDLSRLQAGVLRPALRPVALEEVIPAALHSLGPRAEAVRVELPDLPDDLVADPALLERVVANLVGNALTWSPDEGSVRLAVHRRGDSIQVHVVDHGPGIRPAQRAQVLQPFHRLGDGAHQPGLGLGLAIADGLTAAMGGHLELRDTPGGGLTAVITLPRATEGAA